MDYPKGLDLSHNNGEISFHELAQNGVSFVILKATEGTGFVDPMFGQFAERARSVGIMCGAYHFHSVGNDEAQAEHFLSTVKGVGGQWLWLSPDLEEPAMAGGNPPVSFDDYCAGVGAWLRVVDGYRGVRSLVYSYPDFMDRVLRDGFTGHPLWSATYGRFQPHLGAWSSWTVWQTSGAANFPGVDGPVDTDLFNGTLDELKALLR